MDYIVTTNANYNSVEVKFSDKPSETVREALKALKFRWNGKRGLWYGFADIETVKAAIDGREAPAKADSEKPAQSKPAQNKFGVKVGDLFYATWGYEQTNADFFQVVALVGTQSVRVRQVYPPLIEEDATGPMSADRTYKTSSLPILPPAPCSVFIKDQENGDLKRLKSYDADGKGHPLFYLASFANAHHCTSDTRKMYESWYA